MCTGFSLLSCVHRPGAALGYSPAIFDSTTKERLAGIKRTALGNKFPDGLTLAALSSQVDKNDLFDHVRANDREQAGLPTEWNEDVKVGQTIVASEHQDDQLHINCLLAQTSKNAVDTTKAG